MSIDNFPQKTAVVEALIFSSRKMIEKATLLKITELEEDDLDIILEYLQKKYNKNESGIQLKTYNQRYVFQTKEIFSDYIEQLFDISRVSSLSTAAMETLAIVAYRQPVTRTEIEEIRGVRVSGTLNTLSKYELIEEIGRKDTIGNPIIYGTTDKFLEYLDIKSLSELPEVERVEQLFAEEIEEAAEKVKSPDEEELSEE